MIKAGRRFHADQGMPIKKTKAAPVLSARKQAETKKPISRKSKASAATAARTVAARSKPMNEQFTRQAQDMFRAAQDAKIPEQFQAFAEDGVAKTREAYQKLQSATKDNAKVVEEFVLAAQAGAKVLGDKVIENTTANTAAVFDAAQAMARARSLPEAARLQADFVQQQMAAASSQTKELFELSAKMTRQAIESVNAAAARSFDTLKR